MSGPKRSPDKLNTIGIVVIGICSAVLVYVTIVALQAFYMNDTSEIQTMADYGGQETTAKTLKADQIRNINEPGSNPGATTYHIKVDDAIKLVVADAQKDPSHLVPALPPATTPTIQPIFGRPKPAMPPATTPPAGEGAPAAPGTGSAAVPATGSATPAPATTAPATTTPAPATPGPAKATPGPAKAAAPAKAAPAAKAPVPATQPKHAP